jgi:hypothetical protein
VRDQNLPRASEEYNDPDHDYVSTSELVLGSRSDTETEPESLPVDIEGPSNIDSIAHTRTYPPALINGRRGEKGHYSPILGYLGAVLSFIASEWAWYAVRRDCNVGQGWGRAGHRSRWRHSGGKSVPRVYLRRSAVPHPHHPAQPPTDDTPRPHLHAHNDRLIRPDAPALLFMVSGNMPINGRCFILI